jgi:hypothetical protein
MLARLFLLYITAFSRPTSFLRLIWTDSARSMSLSLPGLHYSQSSLGCLFVFSLPECSISLSNQGPAHTPAFFLPSGNCLFILLGGHGYPFQGNLVVLQTIFQIEHGCIHPHSEPLFIASCSPLALSVRYCRLWVGASRLSEVHWRVQRDGVKERSSLLDVLLSENAIQSFQPAIKNILELFAASFNKTRLHRSWRDRCERSPALSGDLSHHHTSLTVFNRPQPPVEATASLSAREAIINPKLCSYINLHCRAARSHI